MSFGTFADAAVGDEPPARFFSAAVVGVVGDADDADGADDDADAKTDLNSIIPCCSGSASGCVSRVIVVRIVRAGRQ